MIFGSWIFSFTFERLNLNRNKVDLEFAIQRIWLLAPLGARVLGFSLALLSPLSENRPLKNVGKLKFLFDSVFSVFLAKISQLSAKIFRYLDRGFLELIGPFGLSQILLALARRLRKLPRRIFVVRGVTVILLLSFLSFG